MQNDIKVKVGADFTIKLEGIPTSGYTWEILSTIENSQLVKLVNTYTNADRTLVGTPAIQNFIFKALSSGSVAITFRHRRLWEKNDYLEDRTFYIQIVDVD